ncbi:MAG: hypothetical protein KIT57_06650 [Blastocatellales bacterium]|nr:hypothetical protein [Blastocatellales bacterium]
MPFDDTLLDDTTFDGDFDGLFDAAFTAALTALFNGAFTADLTPDFPPDLIPDLTGAFRAPFNTAAFTAPFAPAAAFTPLADAPPPEAGFLPDFGLPDFNFDSGFAACFAPRCADFFEADPLRFIDRCSRPCARLRVLLRFESGSLIFVFKDLPSKIRLQRFAFKETLLSKIPISFQQTAL